MSNAPLVLAIDQGGHATRAVVFDCHGTIVASASVPIETLRPRPDFMEDFAERLQSQYQKGSDALKNIKGPIAIYGTSGGAQAFLGLFPEFEDIVIAFDDNKGFDGLEIPKEGMSIPITRPSKDTIDKIKTVIICSYKHDLAIQEKLRELDFKGDIYSMRIGPDAGTEGRPPSLFH